jgi:hypothetical protein
MRLGIVAEQPRRSAPSIAQFGGQRAYRQIEDIGPREPAGGPDPVVLPCERACLFPPVRCS